MRVNFVLLAISFILVLSVLPIPAAPLPINTAHKSNLAQSGFNPNPLTGSMTNDIPVSSFSGTVIGDSHFQPGNSSGSVLYVGNCTFTVPTVCDAIIKTSNGILVDFRYPNNQNMNGLGTGDLVILFIFIPNGTAAVQRTYYNSLRS